MDFVLHAHPVRGEMRIQREVAKLERLRIQREVAKRQREVAKLTARLS